MVELNKLVHVANAAKTNKQRNEVGKELLKIISRKKCEPGASLFKKNPTFGIEKGISKISSGQYGAIFYGCIDNACKTKIAIKLSDEPLKHEAMIAKKLKSYNVPRIYEYKSCPKGVVKGNAANNLKNVGLNNKITDVLYFEYVAGVTLEEFLKKAHTFNEERTIISQVLKTLYNINKKYPSFRHHDLHLKNVMVVRNSNGVRIKLIDFGMSCMDGIENPNIKGFKRLYGIYPESHEMYDAHYFLNAVNGMRTVDRRTKNMIQSILPSYYLGAVSHKIENYRLDSRRNHGSLPTYKEILSNPYFSSAVSNKHNIVANILRPRPSTSKTAPQPKKSRNPASVARELREKEEENAKKQRILKKPGVVAQTVRLLPGRTPRPLVFINKNGDIKINRRKCMSHTKEELIKIAKKRGITLSQSLTKRDMCKELLK